MAGKMLRVRCDAFLWKQSDPEHGCCGEMSPCVPGRSQSTRTLFPGHTAAPPLPPSPSVSEPVGDGQQQVVLLQGLHPAQRLLIQGRVASPRVIQQLLLGRVELPDLCHLLRGDQQQLGNGRSGGHRVAVYPVDLKGFGHVFQTLVCEEDPLVAQQNSGSIFHCGQTRTSVEKRPARCLSLKADLVLLPRCLSLGAR